MRIRTSFLALIVVSLTVVAGNTAPLTAEGTPNSRGGWNNAPPRQILYFTKSAGFEHSVVKRPAPDQLSHSEKILTALGKQHGFEVTCSKDGGIFTPENIARYDVIVFFTSGNLLTTGTDQTPAMTLAGKEALLQAVKAGKGFVGVHPATDAFRISVMGAKDETFIAHGDKVDPFTAMLGAEFVRHGPQQSPTVRVIDGHFPGCEKLPSSFQLLDEWYTFKDFRPDLHVVLALETQGMQGIDYQRRPFPCAWARAEGAGRVYYLALGHREDVWENTLFQDLLLGGIGWAAKNVNANVTPTLASATPGYPDLQPAK
jgi:hypothetical protein